MRFQVLLLACLFAVVISGDSRSVDNAATDMIDFDADQSHYNEANVDQSNAIESDKDLSESSMPSAAPVEQNNQALNKILANEPLEAREALELLKQVAADDEQKQLDAKALVELSDISQEKCQPIPDVFESYLEMNKSLGPYLKDVYWRQVDVCKKNYGARLMKAVNQLDEQVKADINLLGSGLNLPQFHDPQTGIPQNNLIQAIVSFVLAETKRPEAERRYVQSTIFADMKSILVEDCKKVNEALGALMETSYKVENHRLSLEEVGWLTNGRVCAQLTRRNPATIRLASTIFNNNYKAAAAN